jgi:sulfur relay protein TusB/DsrH
MDVAIYLLGDGVLCAKKGQKGFLGECVKTALQNGISIKANIRDLQARAIFDDQVEPGIEILNDLEGAFVDDAMEKADRVISW